MKAFEFTINKSFLGGAGHPITVPKSQLPYDQLLAADLDHENVTVILPQGERFEARIYSGTAGFGGYYQIRFKGKDRTLPEYLKRDTHVSVLLTKLASRSCVILENGG